MTERTAKEYGPLFWKLQIPEILRPWLKPEPWKGGLIYGPPDSGKTHRAAGRLIGAMLDDRAASGVFVNLPEMLAAMQAAVRRSDDDLEAIADPVLGCRYAVLDDLGPEKLSEWSYQMLYMIVNARQAHNRPTIVTTNLTLEELELKDARLASRILAFGEPEAAKAEYWRERKAPEIAENRPYCGEPPAEKEPERRTVVATVSMGDIYRSMGHANVEAFSAFWANENRKRWKGGPVPGSEMGRRRELVRRAMNGETVSIEEQQR